MGPGDLERLLARLPLEEEPRLLTSLHSGEDAGVYLLTDDLAIVLTVDFFPPIVDDPYQFGQIAAANALSDIYAMNAKPLAAMNLAAFPCGIGDDVLEAILKGGNDKVHEAGAVLAGGHTIEDDELKFGLSVMGTVRPDEMTTLRGAKPGDSLVLTKAIGTGIIATALKAEVAPLAMDEVITSMCALNGEAAGVIASHGVNAMTDVTGFGLAGHAYELARASGVGVVLWAGDVPLFTDAIEMAGRGMAARTSAQECLEMKKVELASAGMDELLLQCMFDPQTSGGLLAAVPSEQADDLVAALRQGPAPRAAVVGLVTQSEVPKVTVEDGKS